MGREVAKRLITKIDALIGNEFAMTFALHLTKVTVLYNKKIFHSMGANL